MNLPVTTTSRVVVAVDRGNEQGFVLELARQIVPAAALEMLGLYVENARLLEHAKSRFAREIMLSGRERPLEAAALERQLRAEATRARAQFETAAARIGVAHEFLVARGNVATELLRHAAEAEGLIVSLAEDATGIGTGLAAALGELLAAPLPLLLIARPGWLLGESIAVVVDEHGAEQETLAVAARIARLSRSPLVALAAAGKPLESLSRSGPRGTQTVIIGELTTANVVAAARQWRARLIVLPASLVQPGLAADLVARLPSALLIVGAKRR